MFNLNKQHWVLLVAGLFLAFSAQSHTGGDHREQHNKFADRVAGTYVIAAYLGDAVPRESLPVQALATLTADG